MSHVFVSYARRDQGFVDRLVAALEAQGTEVWIDRHDIAGGAAWEAAIGEAIRSSEAVIVVLSPAAAESEYISRELSLADKYDRPLVPVLLAPWDASTSERADRLEFQLAGLQHVDFVQQPFGAGIDAVVRALRTPIRARSPARPVAAGQAPAPGGARRLALGAAVGLVAAALAGVLLVRGRPAGPDVTGEWIASARYDWGDEATERFRLAVDGGVVSGTATFLEVPRGIVDGRVDGDVVTLRTRVDAGPSAAAFANTYRGRIDGDVIRFVLQDDRGTPPVELVARRVAAPGTP